MVWADFSAWPEYRCRDGFGILLAMSEQSPRQNDFRWMEDSNAGSYTHAFREKSGQTNSIDIGFRSFDEPN